MLQHMTAHHLTRQACLYVRQSTLQHVFENTESPARQYALRERALALGWAEERIVVIAQDQGHSEPPRPTVSASSVSWHRWGYSQARQVHPYADMKGRRAVTTGVKRTEFRAWMRERVSNRSALSQMNK